MVDNRRWPRVRQADVKCKIEGCDDLCVGNDLCSKHSMQAYRRTEKGRAYVIEYNKRYKRPVINKVCEICKGEYTTARLTQMLCGDCSGSKKAKYLALKQYRKRNIEKVRKRDAIGKRALRKHIIDQECSIAGCNKTGERHHDDYDKPLEITWLCRQHHREVHSKKKKVE